MLTHDIPEDSSRINEPAAYTEPHRSWRASENKVWCSSSGSGIGLGQDGAIQQFPEWDRRFHKRPTVQTGLWEGWLGNQTTWVHSCFAKDFQVEYNMSIKCKYHIKNEYTLLIVNKHELY